MRLRALNKQLHRSWPELLGMDDEDGKPGGSGIRSSGGPLGAIE
jgi:hypothetical protein